MPDINWINVAVRFLHVFAAVVAVGGAVFARFVVHPASLSLPEAQREAFHAQLRPRFARLIMIGIALLLLTGFYNYLRNEMPAHRGQAVYNALMGVKIILAFAVFFLASVLTGRSPAFANLRQNRATWLAVSIALAAAVIILGAILRAIPDVH